MLMRIPRTIAANSRAIPRDRSALVSGHKWVIAVLATKVDVSLLINHFERRNRTLPLRATTGKANQRAIIGIHHPKLAVVTPIHIRSSSK
jgi:hypothetical protein